MKVRYLIPVLLLGVVSCGGDPPGGGTTPTQPVVPVATSITLSSSSVTLSSLGETASLTATVKDQTGAVMSGQTVTWSSSDDAVVTVSNGTVTAVTNGSATITAASGSLSATTSATVAQVAASIALTADTIRFASLGDTTSLGASVADARGETISGAAIVWSSSDTAIATVDSVGLVTAVGDGTASVSVSVQQVSNTVYAEVWTQGYIAWTRRLTSTGLADIWVMKSDGTEPRPITTVGQGGGAAGAAWSPDNQSLLLSGNAVDGSYPNTYDIWRVQEDGSNPIRLTDHEKNENSPSWSPDDTRIVFQGQPNGDSDILVMDADGTNQVNISDHSSRDSDPEWSPDGARIVFVSDRSGDGQLYLMNPDGTNVQRLTDLGGSDPTWSPNGERIAFKSNRDGNWEIYVMNMDGSGQTRVTNNPAEDYYPTWSPDGERLAFVSLRDFDDEIYLINVDGSNLVRITDRAGNDIQPAWRSSR